MANFLKVSKSQWTNSGLPGEDYDLIVKSGHSIVWSGSAWAFKEATSDKVTGHCLNKATTGLQPDTAFQALYKKLVGKQMAVSDTPQKAGATVDVTNPPKSSVVLLKDAETVGQICAGTSKPYKVYMVSPEFKLAYRVSSGSKQISLRVEAVSSPTVKAKLIAWGFDFKKADDGREYGSVHLMLGSKELASKTLGSIIGSTLTNFGLANIMSAEAVA